MKLTHLLIRRILILLALLLISVLYRCGNETEGTFYLTEKARQYMIDTTITHFDMKDNVGITEGFFMDMHTWYTTHHYFNEWGTDGKAFGEVFAVAYHSAVNNYFFTYVLRADEGFSTLEIEWNQKDLTEYSFENNRVINGLNANVVFLDSMTVNEKRYYDVIEIDYSHLADKLMDNTPVKSYFAPPYGLIKLERKNHIIAERLVIGH